MKPRRHRTFNLFRSGNGSALLTVMMVVMTIGIAGGTLYALSQSMPLRVRRLTDAIRAKAIAEAGVNRAYSMLRNDYAGGLASFPIGATFAGGRYDVRLVPITNGEMRVLSVGQFQTARSRIGADMRNTAITDPQTGVNPINRFRQAIFANGNFTVNGTPKLVRGSMFTNNDWSLSGQYNNIQGLIYARNSAVIPSAYRGAWQEQPFPLQTDPTFAAFIEAARKAGTLTVFNGNTTFPKNKVYNGVVVVNGDLNHNGSGSRTVNGLLYVTGNVTFDGSSAIYVVGSMMVGGNIRFNGTSITVSEFSYDPTYLPVDSVTPEDHVVIDAWWE